MRILIVDDSLTYRIILRKVLNKLSKELEVESVESGERALEAAKEKPYDAILLDMTLPGIDGIETLRRLRANGSKAEVVVISGLAPDLTAATFKALENGALDFVAKPDTSSASANEELLTEALRKLLEIIEGRRAKGNTPKVELPRPPIIVPDLPIIPFHSGTSKYSIIVVGISTGGPAALNRLVPLIPKEFPLPIAIVQHMPPVFTTHLAAQLDKVCPLHVHEAIDGEKLAPGNIYIAPGGSHLKFTGTAASPRLQVDDSEPVNSCRPSVDVLFDSALATFNGRILATVLTGMGNDGAKACNRIKLRGGTVLVQDEDSSVVWGMPGAVVRSGSADEILPLDRIVSRWVELIKAVGV